jgi:two-component system sensor histidine kinase DegS
MSGDLYTPKPMEPARAPTEPLDNRFDGLHAEAKAAVGYSANTLRSVRERYREAYAEALGQWQALRDQLDAVDRAPGETLQVVGSDDAVVDRAADAAEAGAEDARRRMLHSDVDVQTVELGDHQGTLARLELAEHTLERTWLFLERRDATLIAEADGSASSGELKMRIVEAQEAERSRLAQEIHDGPAQSLANAIFQVEYIERIIETDVPLARTELRLLRELLRRELGGIRAFISQLRPPLLDQLGLEGAIVDTVEHMRTLTGLAIETDLTAPAGNLSDGEATTALRVAQEALQNVRKHAEASLVTVTTLVDGNDWVLEVRDDGRGFDVGAVAARGRRNFGLQFMRERAELIGARFDVRSRPDGGTVVRLAIPTGATMGGEHSP